MLKKIKIYIATGSYLGNAKEACLPHSLRQVVPKVLIVLTLDNRRNLPQSILWVFTEKELFELRNWKVVTEQKLKLAERARDEYQKMTEELKTVLEDKENELRLAKEKAVQEYHDSDALLTELGVSYNDGFDDALHQAKALYPKLDFSAVNINIAEATSVQPDASDDTNELFAEEGPVTVVPEVHAEEGKTHEAKDPVVPDM